MTKEPRITRQAAPAAVYVSKDGDRRTRGLYSNARRAGRQERLLGGFRAVPRAARNPADPSSASRPDLFHRLEPHSDAVASRPRLLPVLADERAAAALRRAL